MEGNLGPRQTRMRLLAGLGALVLGLALAAWLIQGDHGRWLRLVTLPLFLLASLSLIQAREKT